MYRIIRAFQDMRTQLQIDTSSTDNLSERICVAIWILLKFLSRLLECRGNCQHAQGAECMTNMKITCFETCGHNVIGGSEGAMRL